MFLFTSPTLYSLLAIALYRLYRQLTKISIAHVPGPQSNSFFLGNLGQLAQGEATESEHQLQAQFGDIIRIKALFNEDQLLISDPKALQYIFQTSGYNFPKPFERREISRLIAGKGILWADGDIHKRQRKVMLPGFSGSEAKGHLPVFVACAAKMGEKWRDIVASNGDQSAVVNIPHWMSRCTLDAIGEVAFDYQFGALDDANDQLGAAFSNFLLETFGQQTRGDIFFQHFMAYIPGPIQVLLGDHLPSQKLSHARNTAKLSTEFAKELVNKKAEAYLQGKANRDILSLLVRANASEQENTKLTEEELFGIMLDVILAGHETTANTFSWMLLELSRHHDIQTKLREEIVSMQQTLQARGASEYTAADLDSMQYLNAVLKETLRYHPVAFNTFRQAAKDDVLPLSKPITTASGELIYELPIPKGQKIIASICGYNRNKDIFGPDAHLFNPERWLNSGVRKASSVGVVGNLMSFAGGVRSCIGWKFAVAELQTFIFELVGSFEFLLPPDAPMIRRESALTIMVPTVEGQAEKGSQLPLRIRVASREEL